MLLSRFLLNHFLDQLVDFFTTGTGFTTLHEMQQLGLARESALGLDSLKGHKKLLACLKVGPTVTISCTRSAVHLIPYAWPSPSSMTELSAMGMRCLLSLRKSALVDEFLYRRARWDTRR